MANLISPDIDFAEYAFIGKQESQWIRPAKDFRDSVIQRRDGAGIMGGDPLPWDSGMFLRFRPGEVTDWLGYNHHGKSRIAGMVCAWLMRDRRHLIASFEMPADATLQRMIAQSAGHADYTNRWVDEWLALSDDRLWLYDVQERTSAERVLGLAYYGAQELEIDHMWIDSLMQCGMSGETRDSYQKQALFIDDLCRAAKFLKIHIHIVHHLRKPADAKAEEKAPNRYDARGAGELVDRADNVIIIHKNVRKFRLIEEGDAPDDIETYCDGKLIVDKQRHSLGPGTGCIRMWDHDSGQWTDRRGRKLEWIRPALKLIEREPGSDDDL